jgi:tetratricopeptide (TPR) repeat protein
MTMFVVVLALSAAAFRAQAAEPGAPDRYYQQGEQALAQGRYEDAARAYEKLRELSPDTAEVHARLGLIYFQQREFGRAVPTLRRALKLKPALPKVDVLLAMSLAELGHFKEALLGLQKALRQSSDAPLRRMGGLQLLRAYTGLQQDDQAVEVALELSRLFPDDPEVLYHAGRLFANYAYLQTMKLRDVAPDSVWLHQATGEAYESQGAYDAAVRKYRQVLALDPRRPGLHFRAGRALLARAQQPGAAEQAERTRQEAAQEFEAELRLDPTNASAAYELGEMRRRAGDLEGARGLFERALEHYPDFAQARVALGRVLIALGAPERALPHLQHAVSLDAEDDVGLYQLSVAHGRLGNAAEQRAALDRFQRLRERTREREALMFAPPQVTPQELDTTSPPP